MVVDRADLEAGTGTAGSRPEPRSAVDGVVAGRGEVWFVVARPGEDPAAFLRDPRGADREARICRAVLPDGTLVMADCDPSSDPLLSELLGEGRRGIA